MCWGRQPSAGAGIGNRESGFGFLPLNLRLRLRLRLNLRLRLTLRLSLRLSLTLPLRPPPGRYSQRPVVILQVRPPVQSEVVQAGRQAPVPVPVSTQA